MARLARTVIVEHPDSRERVVLAVGTDLPAWAAEMVSNPAALETDVDAASNTVAAGGPAVDDVFGSEATVREVLAWVGDDPVRARHALDAEMAKGEDARSSLVARLETVADTGS